MHGMKSKNKNRYSDIQLEIESQRAEILQANRAEAAHDAEMFQQKPAGGCRQRLCQWHKRLKTALKPSEIGSEA